MEIFDSHSHLEMPRLFSQAEKVIKRAKTAGVIGVIVSAIEPKFYPKAIDLVQRFPGFIWATFGLHPPRATPKMVHQCLQLIRDQVEHIVAVGEVGLDYHWVKDQMHRDYQHQAFREFLHLAIDLDLPVVVHSREAEVEALQILKEEKMQRIQLHCFNNPDFVLEAANQNWFMSVPTSVVSRKRMQRISKIMPLKNMLLETDAPYLSPFPGSQNEPANIPFAVEKIAELKGTIPQVIAQITTKNALTFFRLSRGSTGLERL